MNNIISFQNADDSAQKFVLEPFWASFLFSDIYIFLESKAEFDFDGSSVTVHADNTPDLLNALSESLEKLLKHTYLPPSEIDVKLNPGRYEHILCNGDAYVVKYRLFPPGRLAFAIYCLIKFVVNVYDKGSGIVIFYS